MLDKLIVCDKNISFGMPTLKGRRLTVYDIVTKLHYEESLNLALAEYEISLTEAKLATDYCHSLYCQKDSDRIHYCNGCILRTIEEGREFNKADYEQIGNELTFSSDQQLIYLGSIGDLEEEKFGRPGWVFASLVKEKYPELI